jgi:hypothetical protein
MASRRLDEIEIAFELRQVFRILRVMPMLGGESIWLNFDSKSAQKLVPLAQMIPKKSGYFIEKSHRLW